LPPATTHTASPLAVDSSPSFYSASQSQPAKVTDSAVPAADIVLGDAVVPKEIAATAIQGNYVNLANFLMQLNPIVEQDTITLRNGKLSISSKLSTKSITTYQLWLAAWSNFEELLMQYLPPELNFYSKAAKYRRFIHTCQEKYSWQSVYTYDTKFRTGLAKSNSFAYDECDIRLFALTFDALALRKDVSHCFHCQSLLFSLEGRDAEEGKDIS
jgi:hypothetical protein